MDEKNLNNGQDVKEQKPVDENMTLDVKNPQLEEMLEVYAKEKNGENLNKLLNVIHHCRVLVPAKLNEEKRPVPLLIKSNAGDAFFPIYTSKEQLPKEPKSMAILNLPYEVVNQMAAKPELAIEGVVINPFSNNLIFKKPLLEKVAEVDKKRREQPQQKTVKLTQEQYDVLMRRQYEFGFLPKKFFTDGQEFIDTLCEKKEEFVDQLYEDSYQEKRLYPYLPEDFSVMVMDISEELLIVRVDFPERQMTVPSCYRIYFTWNSRTAEGRYFTIEKTKDNETKLLGEMTAELKHESLGAAPVEGAELQEIINLHNRTSEMTS